MKRHLYQLLWISIALLSAGLIEAQPRVLIVHGDYARYPVDSYELDNVARSYVPDVDTTTSYLPEVLSVYSAILLGPSVALADSDKVRILHYIESGGYLYTEDVEQFEPDTLVKALGVRQVGMDAAFHKWDSFHGVAGTFTEDYHQANPDTDPTHFDVSGGLHLNGDISPVLEASPYLDLAWIPIDTTLHAVLAWPATNVTHADFLHLVLCDYFNLCSAGVRGDDAATLQIELTREGNYWHLTTPLTLSGVLRLFDEAGRLRLSREVRPGEHIILSSIELGRMPFGDIVTNGTTTRLKVLVRP